MNLRRPTKSLFNDPTTFPTFDLSHLSNAEVSNLEEFNRLFEERYAHHAGTLKGYQVVYPVHIYEELMEKHPIEQVADGLNSAEFGGANATRRSLMKRTGAAAVIAFSLLSFGTFSRPSQVAAVGNCPGCPCCYFNACWPAPGCGAGCYPEYRGKYANPGGFCFPSNPACSVNYVCVRCSTCG